MWVVKKGFTFDQARVKKCYAQIAERKEEAYDIMKKQAAADVVFLGLGLTNDDSKKEYHNQLLIDEGTKMVIGELEKGQEEGLRGFPWSKLSDNAILDW